MDQGIVEGNIGTVGSYDIEIKGGNLVIVVKAGYGPLMSGISIELKTAELLDIIAKAIPGTVDDAVLGVIKAALAAK